MNRFSPCAAALLLFVVPSTLSAQANCPTGHVLDGVYLTFGDRITHYERLSTGQTFEREVALDGSFTFAYRTHPNGLLAESWEEENGRIVPNSFEGITYSGLALPMADPTPGSSWSGRETATFTDNTTSLFDTTVSIGAVEPWAIGACQYTALPITVQRRWQSDGSLSTDALSYINELGIVVYLGTGEGVPPILDRPVEIGVYPPGQVVGQTPTTPPQQPGAPLK